MSRGGCGLGWGSGLWAEGTPGQASEGPGEAPGGRWGSAVEIPKDTGPALAHPVFIPSGPSRQLTEGPGPAEGPVPSHHGQEEQAGQEPAGQVLPPGQGDG